MEHLKCIKCRIIPDSELIWKCTSGHIYCQICNTKDKCSSCKKNKNQDTTLIKAKNPILVTIRTVSCKYSEHGCTWSFSAKKLEEHIVECKFRPISCIGNALGVWICPWTGMHCEIGTHLKEAHSQEIGREFSHRQMACVPYRDKLRMKLMNTINAFNRVFIFMIISEKKSQVCRFIVFVMGRKEEADQFVYHLTFKDDKHRRMSFIETIYSDADDIGGKIKEGKCVVLTKQSVVGFVHKNNLHFELSVVKKITDPNVVPSRSGI